MSVRFPAALGAGFLLLSTALLGGCLSHMVLPTVTDAADAPDGTILVGKVRLEPPLGKDEQVFAGNVIGEGSLINSVVLLTSTTGTTRAPEQPSMRELHDSIQTRFDEIFVVKAPPAAFNITGGMISLELNARGADYAWLPGRLQVPIRQGDRALYVGTLVFHRNDFFEITRVDILDEFAAAERVYRKQVSGAPPLRKGLLKKLPH